MLKLPDFAKAKEMLEKILQRQLNWVERLELLNKLHVDEPRKLLVYAFAMNNTTVKIGVTKNELQRAKSIESSTGLKVLKKYHTKFAPVKLARMIETSCHKKFENFRVHGEYFNVNFEEACIELRSYEEEIDTANKKAIEEYKKAVSRAWEVLEELEDNYLSRPAVKQPDLLAPFADFVALEREKFTVANSEESKKMVKVQLIRELASASKDDNIRNELVFHAAKLLIGEDFVIPTWNGKRVKK